MKVLSEKVVGYTSDGKTVVRHRVQLKSGAIKTMWSASKPGDMGHMTSTKPHIAKKQK
jgi:hypothetical protein